jgi:apolipoprotein D and lipocalin family protein
MLLLRSSLFVVALLAMFLAGCSRQAPLPTVGQVDLKRYAGDWFVIAHIPYSLEEGKVATFDRYRLRDDGLMDNEYWFRRESFAAPEEVWKGVAWVHDTTTNAEWRVQFLWPFRIAYLIIDLDPEYRWAVVGHPSRNYFWILARERTLPESTYDGIVIRAAAKGYDVDRFRMVPQPLP